jgi:allantoinase
MRRADPTADGAGALGPPGIVPIVARPALRLPGNARVAVCVVLNIEVFSGPGRPHGPALQPHLQSDPEIANWGWRDYGNRVGFWRLSSLFDELEIPVTAAMNGAICDQIPQIAAAVRARGWGVVAHGMTNSVRHAQMTEAEERDAVRETSAALRRAFGTSPRGWLTPGFAVSENTHRVLFDAGYQYTLDWTNDDLPYWLGLENESLLALPYSLESNDISLCLSCRFDGPAFGRAIEDHVTELLADGAATPRTTTVSLHTFLAGQPGRIRYLRTALATLRRLEGIWWTTTNHLADLIISTPS